MSPRASRGLPLVLATVTGLALAPAAALTLVTTADASDAPTLVAVGYASDARAVDAARVVSGALVRDLAGPRVALVTVTDVDAARAAGAGDARVRFVDAPGRVTPENAGTADALASAQWALDAARLPDAWRVEPGNGRVTVAVLDSGVDLAHADLRGNLWTNPRETVDGVDEDGNGFVDDVHGVDYCRALAPTGAHAGSTAPWDTDGHGTAVAGVIAAERGNGVGVAGAADARVMPLKVLGAGCAGTLAAAAAVTYAVDHGARVISMSWHAEPGPALEDALAYAHAHDVLLVKSAGNENGGPVTWPGTLPFVLAVGATHAERGVAPFSSHGRHVALAAPGENVLSTAPGNAYAYHAGTSFAAPLVAGVAALVMSACPHLDAAGVRTVLTATARDAGAPGHDEAFGHGVVDARAAVTRCAEALTPPPATPPARAGSHAPIVIHGDAAFCAPGSGVVNCATADGSPERPYRIAGWSFTLPEPAPDGTGLVVDAIRVEGTTRHFVIERNAFRDMNAWQHGDRDTVQTGVHLVDVAPGSATVRDNVFQNVGNGIVLEDAPARVAHNSMRDVWKYFVRVNGHDADAAPVIERNAFQDGHGMVLVSWIGAARDADAWSVIVRHNNFGGNVGVNTAELAGHDARGNWWGDARGPDKAGLQFEYEVNYRGYPWAASGHALRDATHGDQVLHAHNVWPWLDAPVDGAGARFPAG